MPRNPTLSFTATPDLKTKIESIAKASGSSRSKAIVGLVSKGLSEQTEPMHDQLLLEIELLTKALEGEASRAEEYAQEVECLTAYYKSEIEKLQHQAPPVPKYESVLKQLPVEDLIELFRVYHYYAKNDFSPFTYCNLDWEEDEVIVDATEEELLRKFFAIADEVNKILWQVDNTSQLVTPSRFLGDEDVWAISEKLVKYGLLQPYNHPGCSAYELWDFIQTHEDSADSLPRILSDAIEEERLDIVAAVLPWKPPIERGAYWHNYYSSCIGSEKVKDVWTWKDNPEAYQVNEELSTVLNWDEPEQDVTTILGVLYENKDPFYKKESQVQQNGQFIGISFGDFLAGGKFQNWEEDRKTQAKSVFRQWHSERLQELGQERLERCYKVVFGCDWDVIESLTMPDLSGAWWNVFSIKPSCTESQLKAAYRTLAKRYHPDVNRSDAAKRAIQAINRAYEEGKVAIASRTRSVGRSYSWHNDPRPEWQRCGYASPEAYKEAEKRMMEELADIPF